MSINFLCDLGLTGVLSFGLEDGPSGGKRENTIFRGIGHDSVEDIFSMASRRLPRWQRGRTSCVWPVMIKAPETLRPPTPFSSLELASRNTSLALQRTRMGADRTLMAVIRTSLSLISFGFTIFKVVQNLAEVKVLKVNTAVPHFGIGLVLFGILMLVTGIIYHGQFMWRLRAIRKGLVDEGLIHGEMPFPPSFTLATAIILFGIGVAAILSMFFRIGPFG